MSHSGPAATFDAVTKVVARGSPSYTSRCARLLELTPARHGEAARIEIFYGATLIGNPVQRGLHIARSQLLSMAHADLICPSRGRWARPHSSHSAGLPPQPFLSPGAATRKVPRRLRLHGWQVREAEPFCHRGVQLEYRQGVRPSLLPPFLRPLRGASHLQGGCTAGSTSTAFTLGGRHRARRACLERT